MSFSAQLERTTPYEELRRDAKIEFTALYKKGDVSEWAIKMGQDVDGLQAERAELKCHVLDNAATLESALAVQGRVDVAVMSESAADNDIEKDLLDFLDQLIAGDKGTITQTIEAVNLNERPDNDIEAELLQMLDVVVIANSAGDASAQPVRVLCDAAELEEPEALVLQGNEPAVAQMHAAEQEPMLVVATSAAGDLDAGQGLLEILQHFPAGHSAPTQLGTEPDNACAVGASRTDRSSVRKRAGRRRRAHDQAPASMPRADDVLVWLCEYV
jgi:hypothetical protein